MKRIKPLTLPTVYEIELEKRLSLIFFETLYESLADKIEEVFGGNVLGIENARGSRAGLTEALGVGRVQYSGDYFTGSFNSHITKELKAAGATWDGRKKGFKLEYSKLPARLRTTISGVNEKVKRLGKDLTKYLDNLSSLIESSSEEDDYNFEGLYGQMLATREEAFRQSIAKITVAPEFTETRVKQLVGEYSHNMNLYIKGWTRERILRLRQKVMDNTFAGFRAEGLIKSIRTDYGVSESKAKFLARQETGLLIATYREARYGEAGLNIYQWSTSKDARVRVSHKLMEDKYCRFDNPHVYADTAKDAFAGRWKRRTDDMTHTTAGHDFLCRCLAVAIVE
jgi:SPP1 gp7 family putative phage head morphogenesis protein